MIEFDLVLIDDENKWLNLETRINLASLQVMESQTWSHHHPNVSQLGTFKLDTDNKYLSLGWSSIV